VSGPRERFSGSVRIDDAQVVVTVLGEVDLAAEPQFRAVMDEAVAVGAPLVTVDLAGVEFFDARGLAVLALASERLHLSGSRLTVRGASAWTYRVFEIAGLSDALEVERPPSSPALVRVLAGIAAIPLTRDVLDAALKLVVTMAQAVVVGADGVSITLPRQGRLGTVAASNAVVLEMDHDQYDTGEGPCLDAATQGERFHIDSLRQEQRWPAFVPRARARGIESILSTPLVTAERPVGALNVYSRKVGAFAVHEKRWADQFAAEAATVVSSAALDSAVQALDAGIQRAPRSREVIALAQGVLIHRDGVSPTAAHAALTLISRRTGRPLREVCDELVRSSSGAAATRGIEDRSTHV